MLDIQKILGQIDGPFVEKRHVILLQVAGEFEHVVAIAAYDISASGVTLRLYELTVTPDHLLSKGKVAGGTLLEWLARKIPTKNGQISLLSLGDESSEVYAHWGFVGSGEGMTLKGDKLEEFLKKHKVFAPK